VEILKTRPYPHRAARFVDGYGSLFMIPAAISLTIAVMMWATSQRFAPSSTPGFAVWTAASAAILVAMIATRIACTRLVGRDGREHAGIIATAITVPTMHAASDLPANIKQLADELDRHRTASHGLPIAPAFDAYTAALTAVADAAHAHANMDPDAAAATAH